MARRDTGDTGGEDRLEGVLAAISDADRTGLLLRDAQNAVSMMEANGVPRDEIAGSISRSFLSIPQPPDEAYLKQATERAKQDAVKRTLGIQAAQEREDAEYADRVKKVANRQQIRGDDVPVEAEPPATATISPFALGRQSVDGEQAVRRRTTAEHVDAMQSAEQIKNLLAEEEASRREYARKMVALNNLISDRKQQEEINAEAAAEDAAQEAAQDEGIRQTEKEVAEAEAEAEADDAGRAPVLHWRRDGVAEYVDPSNGRVISAGRPFNVQEAEEDRADAEAQAAAKAAAGYGEAAEKRAAVTESDRFKAEERLAKAEVANEINPGKNEEEELAAAQRNYDRVFGKRVEGVGGRFGPAKPSKDFAGELGDAPADLKEIEAELANLEGSKFYAAAAEVSNRPQVGGSRGPLGSLSSQQRAVLAKANALRNQLAQRKRLQEAYRLQEAHRLQEAPFQETSPELEEVVSPAPVPEPVPEPIPEDVPGQTQTKPAKVEAPVVTKQPEIIEARRRVSHQGLGTIPIIAAGMSDSDFEALLEQ